VLAELHEERFDSELALAEELQRASPRDPHWTGRKLSLFLSAATSALAPTRAA
jgi:hypothetical protein